MMSRSIYQAASQAIRAWRLLREFHAMIGNASKQPSRTLCHCQPTICMHIQCMQRLNCTAAPHLWLGCVCP